MRSAAVVGVVILGLMMWRPYPAPAQTPPDGFLGPDRNPQGLFGPHRNPQEVRLILRDSADVTLVHPFLANSMVYGFVRWGPYKVGGLDSIPVARVRLVLVARAGGPSLHWKDVFKVLGVVTIGVLGSYPTPKR